MDITKDWIVTGKLMRFQRRENVLPTEAGDGVSQRKHCMKDINPYLSPKCLYMHGEEHPTKTTSGK